MELSSQIEKLEELIKVEKQSLQYTEGQQYYRTKRHISELQSDLRELKQKLNQPK